MDREQFDGVARLAWTRRSRRAAVAMLLGAELLGYAPTSPTAKPLDKMKWVFVQCFRCPSP